MNWDDVRSFISQPETGVTVGSLLSIHNAPGDSWRAKLMSFLCGMGLGFYVVPLALEFAKVESRYAYGGFGFLAGYVGMNLLAKFGAWVSETKLGDIISVLWRKQ